MDGLTRGRTVDQIEVEVRVRGVVIEYLPDERGIALNEGKGLVGILCVAAVSIVVGGLLGTAMGYAVSLPQALRAKKAEVKA